MQEIYLCIQKLNTQFKIFTQFHNICSLDKQNASRPKDFSNIFSGDVPKSRVDVTCVTYGGVFDGVDVAISTFRDLFGGMHVRVTFHGAVHANGPRSAYAIGRGSVGVVCESVRREYCDVNVGCHPMTVHFHKESSCGVIN